MLLTFARYVIGASTLWFAYVVDDPEKVKLWVDRQWKKVVPTADRARGIHGAATAALVDRYERLIGWLYGRSIWSIRGVWTALMVSLCSIPILLLVSVGLTVHLHGEPSTIQNHRLLAYAIVIGGSSWGIVGFLAGARLPGLLRPKKWSLRTVADILVALVLYLPPMSVLVAIAWGFIATSGSSYRHAERDLALLFGFGIIENMISMSLLKSAASIWKKNKDTPNKIRKALLGLVVVAAAVVALGILFEFPVWVAKNIHQIDKQHPATFIQATIVGSLCTNACEMLLVLLVGGGVLFLVIHLMCWVLWEKVAERVELKWLKRALYVLGGWLLLGGKIVEMGKKVALALAGE
jgi:hypothetical protein